jgi:hypothetical protein
MSGNHALLDSNIIIHISKGTLDMESMTGSDYTFSISVVTYMEVMGYAFNDEDEKTLIENLLKQFKVLYIDRDIADEVVSIRARRRIKLPDAIIFATAKIHKCVLFTRNIEDFKNIDTDVSVISP